MTEPSDIVSAAAAIVYLGGSVVFSAYVSVAALSFLKFLDGKSDYKQLSSDSKNALGKPAYPRFFTATYNQMKYLFVNGIQSINDPARAALSESDKYRNVLRKERPELFYDYKEK